MLKVAIEYLPSDRDGKNRRVRGPSTRELIQMGEAAFSSGELEKAKECFERALSREVLNVDALHNLGLIHLKLGNVQGSLGYFTRALEWDPEDKEVIKSGDRSRPLQALSEKNPGHDEGWKEYEFLLQNRCFGLEPGISSCRGIRCL